MKNHRIIRTALLAFAALAAAVQLTACTPAPPHTKVTVVVLDGEAVAWDPSPVTAELAARNGGCIDGAVMADFEWTGGAQHGRTWPFKAVAIDRPVVGDKEVGFDFAIPFGATEACG